MKKVWHLVSVRIAREQEEAVSSLLFDLGTGGIITLEETAESTSLGAYFDESADPEDIKRALEKALQSAGHLDALDRVSISEVPDQDWMRKWKEGFEPIPIGDRLVVAPSWKMPEESSGRVRVQIDPGMAFGTGTHETTRLCLEAIEARFVGGRLLDVGTGTGILAIAAARLAPGSRVTAIDVDPLAVEIARENTETNGVSAQVEVLEGQPADFTGRDFDAVVANLTAEVILSLMDDIAGCLAPSGLVVLSGILTNLAPDVERAAAGHGLEIIERREAGEWSLIVARGGER